MSARFTKRPWTPRTDATVRLASGLLAAIVLAACGGGGGGSSPPPAQNPVPVLTSISPTNANAGDPAFTMTLNGSSFISSSTVRWNGSSRSTTFVSATQLTASILASDIADPGTASVTVSNPAPGGGISSAKTLDVLSGVPVLSSLAPSATPAGTQDFTLIVNGSGFVSASTVLWNGNPRTTTFVSSTQLDALILASDVASTGSAPVTVENPPPGGGASGPLTFLIAAAPSGRNDTCATATPISNGRIRASISPYGDIDVYSFHGTIGHQVTMEIFAQGLNLYNSSFPQDSYLDSMMELLDTNCNVLAFDDDISTGTITDSKISVSATPFPPACPPPSPTSLPCADIPPATNSLPYTGTYYIRIRDFRGDGRPDLIYDLVLSGAD